MSPSHEEEGIFLDGMEMCREDRVVLLMENLK
jgi:hypothetical protein